MSIYIHIYVNSTHDPDWCSVQYANATIANGWKSAVEHMDTAAGYGRQPSDTSDEKNYIESCHGLEKLVTCTQIKINK